MDTRRQISTPAQAAWAALRMTGRGVFQKRCPGEASKADVGPTAERLRTKSDENVNARCMILGESQQDNLMCAGEHRPTAASLAGAACCQRRMGALHPVADVGCFCLSSTDPDLFDR